MDQKLIVKPQPSDAERVFSDRKRTNILKSGEQRLILSLLKIIPSWLNPNGLTLIGAIGAIIVFAAFLLATFIDRVYLIIGPVGLLINWFGDSLDGRLAYYRQRSRKWYGFALDIITDWIAIVWIGLGYFIYAPTQTKVLGFLFVVLYAWSIIIALLRYKITDVYTIDSGYLGPTELRVIISLLLLLEVVIPGSLNYAAGLITLLLFAVNTVDSRKLLRAGNIRDMGEHL